jgi:hypothetical protein
LFNGGFGWSIESWANTAEKEAPSSDRQRLWEYQDVSLTTKVFSKWISGVPLSGHLEGIETFHSKADP